MQIYLLKSKIHRATITGASLEYQGSLSIDESLMNKVGLFTYERILCSNLNNGNRFETYAIPAPPGSGQIILNGAAAHLGKKGDQLIIMSFTRISRSKAKKWSPKIIVVGKGNRIVSNKSI